MWTFGPCGGCERTPCTPSGYGSVSDEIPFPLAKRVAEPSSPASSVQFPTSFTQKFTISFKLACAELGISVSILLINK